MYKILMTIEFHYFKVMLSFTCIVLYLCIRICIYIPINSLVTDALILFLYLFTTYFVT